MTRQIANLLNHLFSGGLATASSAFVITASVFGVLWGLASAAGVEGGPTTVIITLLLSVLPTIAVLGLRPVRWTLLAWLLQTNIDRLVQFGPDLVIGLGPGGAIIAGMIAKMLAAKRGEEPLVYVVNRTFKWEGKRLDVSLVEALPGATSVTGAITGKRVLLVTPEVHTGGTIKKASEYLSQLGIDHRTFCLIRSPSSVFAVDISVLDSDKRGLLPWHDAPQRDPSGKV